MTLVDVVQLSPEWLAMRCGACTASRVKDVIARLQVNAKSGKKGDYKTSRANYMAELVCERLTGLTVNHYVTPYMEDGLEFEILARAAYEMERDVETQDGGYAIHPRIEWFGASPDFLCGEDGCGEIKCLKPENHLEIIKNGIIPYEYLSQMCAELACTERQWNDFISYNKDFPKHLRLFVRRLERSPVVEAAIADMEAEVEKFLQEVKDSLAGLPRE